MHMETQTVKSFRGATAPFDSTQHDTRGVVHVPTPMLRDMQKQAQRLDRSVSWCVRMAWNMAAADIRSWSAHDPTPQSRLLKGRKRSESMTMPPTTWSELTVEAARLDRSRSWLVQQAWLVEG